MKILKFVVEGYRSIGAVTWKPGDLTVVRGARAAELQRALALFSALARGWSSFSEAMTEERATEADFWHPEAIEMKLFALCAPQRNAELEYGHEVIVERLDARPHWLIGYERATLSNDFKIVDVLERMGDRVEYVPPRKKLPGSPVLAKAKPEVTRLAHDMSTLSAMPGFRRDPRVTPHIDAIASWKLPRGSADFGPGAPARAPSVPFGFHGALAHDGRNVVNLLANVTDWHDTRRAFDRFARDLVPGYDGLTFPRASNGEARMELRTRDGASTAHHDLPEGTLRALALYGSLLSPEPPTLLWLDAPTASLDPWAAANVAELCLEASRRTQVVVSNPSPELSRRLTEVSRHPGKTRGGAPLKVLTTEL
ncbi:MAG: AAA family ATPase [Polyangiales bacterium]